MEMFKWIFDSLPTLKGKKNPSLAFAVGFLAGGIGLGIYFGSLTDFVLLLISSIVLAVVLPVAGIAVGAFIAGMYGFFRVLDSNAKLGV